jgi:hypothetical protein
MTLHTVTVCQVCKHSMILIEPGQLTQPACDNGHLPTCTRRGQGPKRPRRSPYPPTPSLTSISLCEPFYHVVKGKITLTPCMNLKDLKKGLKDATVEMQAMQDQSAR